MNNNQSKKICATVAAKNGWTKEKFRNVLIINGEKWCFSISTFNPECRQVYEDTLGFITMDRDGNLKKFRVDNFSKYSVSRISPKGIKAYNIQVKAKDMEILI